jgi:hypothetical protein
MVVPRFEFDLKSEFSYTSRFMMDETPNGFLSSFDSYKFSLPNNDIDFLKLFFYIVMYGVF